MFFLLWATDPQTGRTPCLVVKFCATRLETQAEQFGGEITQHLGAAVPPSTVLRKKPTPPRPSPPPPPPPPPHSSLVAPRSSPPGAHAEIKGKEDDDVEVHTTASASASDPCPSDSLWAEEVLDHLVTLEPYGYDLADELSAHTSCLLLRYVPGIRLTHAHAREAFRGEQAVQTAMELGRMLVCDMTIGNADRLPVRELGWRGNLSNVLYVPRRHQGRDPRWAGRVVGIDASVPRKPPQVREKEKEREREREKERELYLLR